MNRLDGTTDPVRDYSVSKARAWLLGIEFGKRHGGDSAAPILSVTQNPGNLRSKMWTGVGWVLYTVLNALVLYDAKYGPYRELYAGLSSELMLKNQGAYIIPWGRLRERTHREDILDAAKPVEEGGWAVLRVVREVVGGPYIVYCMGLRTDGLVPCCQIVHTKA